MRRFVWMGFATVSLGWASCAHTSPRATGQDTESLVRAALAARIADPAGCAAAQINVSEVRESFFPGVRFWVGDCYTQHATPISAIVASDDETIYLLDGIKDFEFLRIRHSPTFEDRNDNWLQFSHVAARLSGLVPLDSRIVQTQADLPRESGLSQVAMIPNQVWRLHEEALETVVTIANSDSVVSVRTMLLTNGAVLRVTRNVLWARELPVH